MSMEIIGAWAAKVGWLLILPYLVWLHKRDKTKLDDTYTKHETSELIDLKIAPMGQKMDNQSKGLHDKFDLLLVLVKSDNETNAGRRKEDSDMLHKISTSVAVIENEVSNLKERIDK